MDDKRLTKQRVSASVNLDNTPILYTDSINMTTNEDGVVLDVLQRIGSSNQARIVARIGMSRQQAKKFLDKFGKLLAMTEGRKRTRDKIN